MTKSLKSQKSLSFKSQNFSPGNLSISFKTAKPQDRAMLMVFSQVKESTKDLFQTYNDNIEVINRNKNQKQEIERWK